MLSSIPTPALVIDSQRVQHNLDRMARYCRSNGLRLRPHTKTHKSRHFAALQVESGADGLTAAKAGEAEIMASLCGDVLLAYPAVDSARCQRIARLAKCADLAVAIDSPIAADALSGAARAAECRLRILVEMDVGMGRTGIPSPEGAVELAAYIHRRPGLSLSGLMFFPGHILSAPQEQREALAHITEKLAVTIRQWERQGLPLEIVSGGSTPTAYQSHLIPQLTEIRPGTYIFNDMNTVRSGCCTPEDCAATIICTVVSDAVPGQVVVDAGSKTLTSDRFAPDPDAGFGHVVEYPQARITRLTEEHGQIDIRGCDRRPRVGERVTVIPNHICPCVNLQDSVWLRRDDGPLEPLKVDARGLLV